MGGVGRGSEGRDGEARDGMGCGWGADREGGVDMDKRGMIDGLL